VAKKKTSTLAKAGKTVKKVAGKVTKAADKYVAAPVGKALGLTGKKAAPKKATAKKATAKTAGAKSKGKSTAAKRTAAKRTTSGK
jgi:hypothetical protein